jgi:two-component system, NtrC family, sensor kinase
MTNLGLLYKHCALEPINIHACIDNTLLILNNCLKETIEITKQYGDLPLVTCPFGQQNLKFFCL